MKEVEARLKISATDKTGGVFNSLASKMERVSRQAAEFNRRNTISARRQVEDFDRINGLYTKTLAALAAGYTAKEAYTDFAGRERALTRIGVTARATDEQLQDVRDTVGRLSKELAMNPDSAVRAIETLVASGKSLEEAMAFLPTVMKGAQATGAETTEMANTLEKSAAALNIPIDQLNQSLDLMVELGKAGQFEAKDMASFIPGLANSWASLGNKGVDGLLKLGANLQTIREDTADASTAATQLGDILGKMYGDETANKFEKMGVADVRKELDQARKSGEDALEAFVRITQRTLKGDLSKLPMLFGDKEMRLGMQSLLTSQDSYKKYIAVGNDPNVAGATDRDVKRITQDAQAPIDRLKASLDRTIQSLGKAVEKPVTAVLDKIAEDTDKESAALRGYQKQGHTGGWEWWKMLNNMPIGTLPGSDEYERAARLGGYVPAGRDDLKNLQRKVPFAYQTLGRLPYRPVTKTPQKFEMPEVFNYQNPLAAAIDKQDAALKAASEESRDNIKSGGEDAGRALTAAADTLREAIVSAAQEGARILNSVKVKVDVPGRIGVNGDTGRQNPADIAKPASLGDRVNANRGDNSAFVRGRM